MSWTRATDATGYFEFLYLPESDYAITIENANLTSDPLIREYKPLNANQEDQNFTVTVVEGGVPIWVWAIISGIIVALVGAILWYILTRKSRAT